MDKTVMDFFIPVLPPSLNVMLRMHYRTRGRFQRIWDKLVGKEWDKRKRYVFANPIKIQYILSFPKRRGRDIDNYIGGTKLITDALKETFFTKDDSSWLKKIEIKFLEGERGTRIIIEEA